MSLIKIWSILQYPILIDDCQWEDFFCWNDDTPLITSWWCLEPLLECGVPEFILRPSWILRAGKKNNRITIKAKTKKK